MGKERWEQGTVYVRKLVYRGEIIEIRFTKDILIGKKNMYSEDERNELKNLDIYTIKEDDLCSSKLKSIDKFNLLVCLQYKLTIEKDTKKLAYLNYLISYYIFIISTPPFSEELAFKYAEDATKLDNSHEYLDWLEYVKKGN